jgi:hypothetical protein
MRTQHAQDIETLHPAVQRPRALRLFRQTAAVVGVFGLALLAASGVQRLLPAHEDRNLPLIQGQAQAHLPPGGRLVTARLSASLLVDGSRLPQVGEVAMADGSAFELLLSADHDGQAQLMAINPAGQATQLWSTHLQAGAEQQSPRLRLQGLRGEETLRILFKPDAHYGQSATLLKQMKILHL